MLNAVPIVMVRNEALWIQAVLRPALAVFGRALVADTGSTDGTAELAEAAGAEVHRLGSLTPAQLGQVRCRMAERARALGADYGMCIDGDELYTVETLRAVAEAGFPPGKATGFSTMITIDLDADTGAYWLLDDKFNRQCVFPVDDSWAGSYPFEIPESFEHPELFHYWGLPAGFDFHALHLHRLTRSPKDADVFMRLQKQKQFCLQDKVIPRVRSFDLEAWLKL